MSWNKQTTLVSNKNIIPMHYYPMVNIRELNSDIKQFKIRGLVISKSSLRYVKVNYESTSGTQATMKAVFNFTIRDSVTDFINITSWGFGTYSKKLYSVFHIGDIISLSNLSIEKITNKDAEYRVQTSSLYFLSMNEKSVLEQYFGPDRSNIASLQNTLLHPMSDHVSLLNIIKYIESLSKEHQTQGQHFTFLAMVKEVGEPTDMLSKTQKDENNQAKILHKLDVVLMDESCKAFPLTVWDLEWINFMKINWVPKVTVISLVDCKVKYDEYKRGMVGLIDQRTVSVQNPDIIECHRLHHLVSIQSAVSTNSSITSSLSSTLATGKDNGSVGLQKSSYTSNNHINQSLIVSQAIRGSITESEIPLNSIQNVTTIRSIKSRLLDTEFVIIYATLTSLSIDDDDLFIRCIWMRCRNCGGRIMPNQLCCISIDCPMLGRNVQWTNSNAVEVHYNTVVSVADHTGSINNCVLGGQVMSDFLRYSPEQLLQMEISSRSQIKWNLFLSRYKFYMKTATPTFDNSSPFNKIIGIQVPTVYEILASVKQ